MPFSPFPHRDPGVKSRHAYDLPCDLPWGLKLRSGLLGSLTGLTLSLPAHMLPAQAFPHSTSPSNLSSPRSLPLALPLALPGRIPLPLHSSQPPFPFQAKAPSRLRFQLPPAPNAGRPGGTVRGGATRSGDCPALPETTSELLTALAPSDDPRSPSWVEGVTLSPSPKFWFYVPTPLTWLQSGRFKLVNTATGQSIYDTWVYTSKDASGKEQSGIVQISLPSSVVALEPEVIYQWSFQIYCKEDPITHVQGRVRRSSPSSSFLAQLQQVPPQEQAVQLAAAGFWYDTLERVTQRLQTQPSEQAREDWRSLLDAVQLGYLSDRPWVNGTVQRDRP